MKVRHKLIVVVLFVALVPVAAVATTNYHVHQQAYSAEIRGARKSAARHGASLVDAAVEGYRRSLSSVVQQSIDWSVLSDAEREGALWLVYGQLPEIAAVALFDGEDELLGHPVSVSHGQVASEWASRPRLARSVAEDLLRSAVKRPRVHHAPSGVLAPMVFVINAARARRWQLVVLVSPSTVCERLAAERPEGTRVTLWDRQGKPVCRAHDTPPVLPFAALPGPQAADYGEVQHRGHRVLVAVARTTADWTVAVEQGADQAFQAAERIQAHSLLWISLGVVSALCAGVILARSITEPLKSLENAARKLASGDMTAASDSVADDEFGDVAQAFNQMAAEIQGWNQELNARVDERTSALRAAEAQLLEAKKMNAVAALTAGVSHELNNPLASVLAFAQILLSDARKENAPARRVELLETLESEAQRIGSIVRRMQELTYESKGVAQVAIESVLDAACSALAPQISDTAVTLNRVVEATLPQIRADPERLTTAVTQVLDNAIRSMSGRTQRELKLRLNSVDGDLVVLEVTDTGRGIAPAHLERVFEPFFTDKDDWDGVGLGLSLVHRVVSEHHGSIKLESEEGRGTTVRIVLPAAAGGAHLV